jgi:hypothetical protein
MVMLTAGTEKAGGVSTAIAGRLLRKQAAKQKADIGPELSADPRSLAAFPFGDGPIDLCIGWRQTQKCSATGPRDPLKDKNCTALVGIGESGYCECYGAVQRMRSNCNRVGNATTCANACAGVPRPPSGKVAAVALHNTLGWTRQQLVTLDVGTQSGLVVRDSTGSLLASQIHLLETSNKSNELLFIARMPPTSLTVFFVSKEPKLATVASVVDPAPSANGDIMVENDQYSLTFAAATGGRLSSVRNKLGNVSASKIAHEFSQYLPKKGNGASGAYIFAPVYLGALDIGDCVCKPSTSGVFFNCKLVKKIDFEAYTTKKTISTNDTVAVFATARTQGGTTFADTFTSTIRAGAPPGHPVVTTNWARTNIDANNPGWGQNPTFAWLMTVNGRSLDYDFLHSGSWDIGTSTAINKVMWFPFSPSSGDHAFSTVPRVLLQTRGEDADDTFVATAFNVTTTGCSVNVTKVWNNDVGWGNSVAVQWLVWEAQPQASKTASVASPATASAAATDSFLEGYATFNTTIWTDKTQNVAQIWVEYPFPSHTHVNIVADVGVVTTDPTISHSPAQFGVTVVSSNSSGFLINANRVAPVQKPVSGAMATLAMPMLTVTYFAFPTKVVEWPVLDDPRLDSAHMLASKGNGAVTNTVLSGPVAIEVQQTFRKGYSQVRSPPI